jgi:integrase
VPPTKINLTLHFGTEVCRASKSTGLVFTTMQGNPVRSAAFRHRVFLPACDRAGVRPQRIHDLRHTCASLLMGSGASPKTVQAWLGHQDFRMTMNTYTHAYKSDL